ncbi:receptor type tyrosine protein phosphatase [Echinococcus multilocularis]|uniref:Receptor type tyrosine protein phosphatase n=1 Tax=Echinococcus multilocularis TaxID=6211 RepID=A0A068Y616_ECHMU|nr:receptor type tyrosine protein phosphatase [Echinococcus multilocularis]
MFPNVYESKLASGILKYEYEVIQGEVDESGFCSAAFAEENGKKNQNVHVIPYNDNCVILEPEPDDEHSTYINASWIDGQEQERKYIATQGPNMKTISDFWRMVWQYNCQCIVMVTSLFEHARQQCERYWPAFSCTFGAINVTSRDAVSTAQYTIREFRVCKNDAPEVKRIIRQFQLDSWNKNGFPLIGAVIELTSKLYAWRRGREGPIVVHCSDGSGRTGTFICINELLDVIRKDEIGANIPLAQYALKVATSRPQMIDSVEQYAFIYTVLAEWVRSGGETSIPLSTLPDVLQQLRQPPRFGYGIGHCASKYEAELTLINRLVKPLTVGECAGGHRLENRRKSRNVLIQPPERARPYLTTQDSGDANDYINAVFVDGYRAKNQYIVTQWPLVSTLSDFWCLVVDFQVSAIALLNSYAFGDQKYPIFWPTIKTANQSTRFGPIGLELREVYEETEIVPSAFLLSIKKRGTSVFNPFMPNRNDNVSRDVILLNTKQWPMSSTDETACDIIVQMAYLAWEWNSLTDANSPILVVSNDGVSRVGVFCAASTCIERILAQSEVDVFRAVEVVKQNRPQLVNDLVEYKQCYNCAFRISILLSARIKANEQERSRDPIEIFDELDRKLAEGEFRRELIDTADQPSKQESRPPSVESSPPSKKSAFSPHFQSSSCSSSCSCSSHIMSPDRCSSDFPKRKLPTVHLDHVSRRLPPIDNLRERHLVITERRKVLQPQLSIPILRSHRILPGSGAARRKLPTLDSIVENPLTRANCTVSNPNRTKKVLPIIINSCPNDGHLPNSLLAIRCRGSRDDGDNLVAPRHPLIRTETETTYLTSSLGDSHQAN